MRTTIPFLLLLLPAVYAMMPNDRYFTITVVDEQTGRGVPLVELRTVNNLCYYTDSNGVIAFDEPGLMNQTVFFYVKSHGYEFPKDGFGYRGKALKVTAGGRAKLAVKRVNVAERLYRITGAGIYRDSVLVGQPVPVKEPLLNGMVFGQDSVVNAIYRGKIYWFWGDTNRPGYPLGNFHVPGATSQLPSDGGLDPEVGVDLSYFVDKNGFAKETARMPGAGPTWISGLVTLRDQSGRERMFAAYVKVRKQLEVYEHGLVEWNDDQQRFEKFAQFEEGAPVYPGGHPFQRVENGVTYIYFVHSYPLTRVRADPESLKRLTEYEAFTCLKEGSRLSEMQLDRAEDGTLRYGWKKNTPPVGQREQANLIKAGKLRPEETLLHLQDADTGKPVMAHNGSVYWNDYRQRWVMIVSESFGTSPLGEIWFAEADTPVGPWVYARKVVTHDRYSFYNPKQHPMFAKDNGRVIFFEGTYTRSFSGNNEPTPRYDYNQIMYKLDLSDSRLVLPVPVYQSPEGEFLTRRSLKPEQKRLPVVFFALDRPKEGTVAVYGETTGNGRRLRIGTPPAEKTAPVFYALPADIKEPPATAVPLYEFAQEGGARRIYSTDPSRLVPGYRRGEQPICWVWRNPMRVTIPLNEGEISRESPMPQRGTTPHENRPRPRAL